MQILPNCPRFTFRQQNGLELIDRLQTAKKTLLRDWCEAKVDVQLGNGLLTDNVTWLGGMWLKS